VKQDYSADAMEQDDSFTYAASTENGESISTAHERDMAHFRDCLQANQLPQIPAQLLIQPSSKLPSQPAVTEDNDVVMEDAVATAPVSTSSAVRKKGKTTTAASFFKTKAAAAKEEGKENKQVAAPSKKAAPKKPAAKTAAAKSAPQKAGAPSQPMESKGKKVGNADDFVGDLEDSDDDDEAMEVDEEEDSVEVVEAAPSKKKARKPAAKKAAKKRVQLDDSDEDEEPEKVTGAMDAFVKESPNKPQQQPQLPSHRPRRKKLVEKTTVDKAGYLHTETVEVWEEIPEEELKKEAERKKEASKTLPVPAAKKKTKAASGKPTKLKQGSLMGFFQKK